MGNEAETKLTTDLESLLADMAETISLRALEWAKTVGPERE